MTFYSTNTVDPILVLNELNKAFAIILISSCSNVGLKSIFLEIINTLIPLVVNFGNETPSIRRGYAWWT